MQNWPRWYRILLALRRVSDANDGVLTSRTVGEELVAAGIVEPEGTDRSTPRHIASAWLARMAYYTYVCRRVAEFEDGARKWHREYTLTRKGATFSPSPDMIAKYAS